MAEIESERKTFDFDPSAELYKLYGRYEKYISGARHDLHFSGVYADFRGEPGKTRNVVDAVSLVARCFAQVDSPQGRFFREMLEKSLEDSYVRARVLLKDNFDLESTRTRDLIRDLGCLNAVMEFTIGFSAYEKLVLEIESEKRLHKELVNDKVAGDVS